MPFEPLILGIPTTPCLADATHPAHPCARILAIERVGNRRGPEEECPVIREPETPTAASDPDQPSDFIPP